MHFLLTKELVERINVEITRFGGMMVLREVLREAGLTLDAILCRGIVGAVMSEKLKPSRNFEDEFVVELSFKVSKLEVVL